MKLSKPSGRGRAARAMHEFFFENLRNPARIRRASLMRQFSSSQLNSSVIMDRWRKTTAVFVSSEKLFVSRP